MAKILIIDEDKLICDWMANVVTQSGHNPSVAYTIGDGLGKVQSESMDVVFLDALTPDGSGLGVMQKIKATGGSPEIIVITGIGDPDEAELAILNGAWDYIEKPVSLETIKVSVVRALEYRADKSVRKPALVLQRKDIIGKSARMTPSLELLAQAANSDVNVLISGETGTGKELFAKAIHSNSKRAGGNFVIVDCTSLPETLVESVLFGHTRGAFTGAYANQEGLVKQADKGTLFLDEIGELPMAIQKSFLRVIQEHRFRPVGGSQEGSSNFRLVAATNRNLESMVRRGEFREDLLFRLRTLVIELPPLKEYLEDIRELTMHYMHKLCQRFEIKPKDFSLEFWDIATRYPWPGNVRELIQALEKALLSAKDEPMLFPKHLPTYIRIQVARNGFHKRSANQEKPETSTTVPSGPPTLKEFHRTAVSAAEKQYFKDLMGFVGGNIDEACRISGLSRSRCYALLKKFRLLPNLQPD
jgi:two-component system NtrC family response regulator